jgi:hypothetical protein
MSLAEAQTLAIRKLLSKSAYDSTLTPGPPLPKSHPSPSLLAKLHLECAELYSSARALAKSASSEVSPDLRAYLAQETKLHGALARKWLGVDAGVVGGDRGGEAVGWLAWAKKELEDGAKANVRGRESVKREVEATVVFLKHYTKVNDSVRLVSSILGQS